MQSTNEIEKKDSASSNQELYKKLKQLGNGSCGTAWLVEGETSRKQLVVKEIDISQMDDDERKQALKESKIMKKFKDPNIIQAYDVYKTKKGKLCIVMEYAEGGDLNQFIQERRKSLKNGNTNAYFSEEQIMEIICQVCLALETVHSRKVIHRDVKSHNIFLTKDMQVKLGDFGVSRILDSTTSRAQTMFGTPYYFSPEMCKGESYDKSVDIWSLGVLIYHMTCLEYPFRAKSTGELIAKILEHKPKSIPSFYSKYLQQIIKGLLQKNPEDRPSLNQVLKHKEIRKAYERIIQKYDGLRIKDQKSDSPISFEDQNEKKNGQNSSDDEKQQKDIMACIDNQANQSADQKDDEFIISQRVDPELTSQVQLFTLDPYEFLQQMKKTYGDEPAQKGFDLILSNTELGTEDNKYGKILEKLEAQRLDFKSDSHMNEFLDTVFSYIVMMKMKC